MQTRKITVLATMGIFAAMLAFTACKRDKNNDAPDLTEDTGYAEDMARIEQTFEDAQLLADQAAETGTLQLKGGPSVLSGCATVTRDTVAIPHTVTADFGSVNCMCADGRNRRGKIIVTYNGRYRDSGYVHTISFDGFYVNDNHAIGTRSVTNMGHNSSGNLYYNVNINGMLVLNTTGDTVKHTATRVRTWTAGAATPLRSDDQYSITGSGSITRASGKVFAISITSPLLIALNCNWIKQGSVSITPAGASFARVLDFGSGTCDDQATISVNSKTKTITLR